VIGANRFAETFIQLAQAYASSWQPVIAVLDDDPKMRGRAVAGVQVLGAPHELEAIMSEFSIHGINTDRVVVSGESDFLNSAALHEIERICKQRQVELSFLPRMIGLTAWTGAVSEGAGTSGISDKEPSFASAPFFRLKRAIDIVGSLVLLI